MIIARRPRILLLIGRDAFHTTKYPSDAFAFGLAIHWIWTWGDDYCNKFDFVVVAYPKLCFIVRLPFMKERRYFQ